MRRLLVLKQRRQASLPCWLSLLLKTFDFCESILRFTGLCSFIESACRSRFSTCIQVLLYILASYNHDLIGHVLATGTFLQQSNTTVSSWTLIINTDALNNLTLDIICVHLLLFFLQKTFVMAHIWIALYYLLHGDANVKFLSIQ